VTYFKGKHIGIAFLVRPTKDEVSPSIIRLIMEALGSALVSMNNPVSSPTQIQQDMTLHTRTPVEIRNKVEEEQIPSIYSRRCTKFDEEAPVELPALQDVSSSSSSSQINDVIMTTGDLIRSLQAAKTNTQEEEVVFDVVWDDLLEEDETEVPGDLPKKRQKAGSIGLLAYTNDRSSDTDRPHQSKVGIKSRDPANVPSAYEKVELTTCSLQSRKQWLYAIMFFFFITIALFCIFMFGFERKSTESNVRPLSSSTQSPRPSTSPTTSLARTSMPTLSPSQTDVIASAAPTVRDETIMNTLPDVPETRFTPFSQLSESMLNNLMRYSLLGYDSDRWDVPGSANNDANATGVFWEGLSFQTIQTTSLQAISAVVRLDFNAQQWDCWVNHYQDFTWDELYWQSEIEIIVDEDEGAMIRGRDLQEAMRILGWTETNWQTSERFEYFFPQGTSRGKRPPWDELTVAEQEAATSTCWNRELWNRIPLLEW
jgi:hypothetical protein